MCLLFLVLNTTCLMPEDRQQWPKHVAGIEGTNKICFGGWQHACQFECVEPKLDEF